ncbi:MAG: hypothetical protein JNL62_13345 [Bryobacterales bacterium]|nr:hypothetical protein [Bryobacterales bacterium]
MRIEILGDHPQVLAGALANISGQGARLQLSQALPINAMVRIDSSEAIYLGEVCYCFEESGVWQVGVQMKHSIPLGHGLRNLSERLREEAGSRDSQRQVS